MVMGNRDCLAEVTTVGSCELKSIQSFQYRVIN